MLLHLLGLGGEVCCQCVPNTYLKMFSNTFFFLLAFSGEVAILHRLEVAVWTSTNIVKPYVGGCQRCKGNWNYDFLLGGEL